MLKVDDEKITENPNQKNDMYKDYEYATGIDFAISIIKCNNFYKKLRYLRKFLFFHPPCSTSAVSAPAAGCANSRTAASAS